jgi:hypothetical protein
MFILWEMWKNVERSQAPQTRHRNHFEQKLKELEPGQSICFAVRGPSENPDILHEGVSAGLPADQEFPHPVWGSFGAKPHFSASSLLASDN